ncbi:uncharacterized protein LOC143026176 isoform X2 [Oratosquilla oratoria]|uniref:uncharacterized protein LOC143026176 isoform X2 n=1 Tax=Oratosquilla oratoria TaxID=337810 RepID=UPI003F76E2A7
MIAVHHPTRRPLLPLLVVSLVLLALATHARALDCRKFVFAPACRGIIAKRFSPDKRAMPRPIDAPRWDGHYGYDVTDPDFILSEPFEEEVEEEEEDAARRPRQQHLRSSNDLVEVRLGEETLKVPAYILEHARVVRGRTPGAVRM